MKAKFQYILFGAIITLFVISGALVVSLQRTAAANSITKQGLTQPDSGYTVNLQLLERREDLADEWRRKMMEQPGWLRIIVHCVQEDEPSMMPGGIVIPSTYTLENWYLLDENQVISIMLGIMRDENGDMVQFSAFQDGRFYNSALDAIYEGEFVLGPGKLILAAQSTTIQQDIVFQDGREVLMTTVHEKFSPAPLDNLDGALASGVVTRDVIDAQTGEPIRSSQTTLLADGSERLWGTNEYVLVDRPPRLPQELDDLLQTGLNKLKEVK